MKTKTVLVALSVLALGCDGARRPLELVRGGVSSYTVVVADEMPETDLLAFNDFTNLLRRATGVEFRVARNSVRPRSKRIFFGIAPEGDGTVLENQERRIVTAGRDLHIYGGGVNGNRYAVYDFLQNDLGFRFFDSRDGMRVPDARDFTMPPTDRRRRHAFVERSCSLWERFVVPSSSMFVYRHGLNNGRLTQLLNRDKVGHVVGDYHIAHPGDATLVHYLPRNSKVSRIGWIRETDENLERDHPEYFSLNAKGKRVFDHQRCLSNPEVKALLVERVLENMRRTPDSTIFDLSAGDTPGRFCHCPGCLALEKKYGTAAGPLLEVFMELCPKAKAEFPDKALMTLIYRKGQTQRPPKGMEAMPDNFVAHFAPIDDDFTKDWTHENNADTLADLKEWTRLCRRTLMWYYPNPYGEAVTPPFGNIERLANDIRIMKEAGVTGVTFEHNVGVKTMTGFTDLQTYVMLRLFDDVTLDWRELVAEFIEFEFGPVAADVSAYLEELEGLRKTMKTRFTWNANMAHYDYLTPDRLVKWNALFDSMEKKTATDARKLGNVRRLRLGLDLSIMRNYRTVVRAFPGRVPPFDALVAEIRKKVEEIGRDCYSPKYAGGVKRLSKNIEEQIFFEEIRSGANAKPIPAEITAGTAPEDIFVTMARCPWRKSFVPDEKAAFGKAAVFDGAHRGDVMAVPFKANIEHVVDKRYIANVARVEAKDLGPRGEYRFYALGRTKLTPSTVLELGAWSAFRCPIGGAYVQGSFNNAKLYASLRFEGPAFYKEDEGKPNMIYCDRVVVVRENR